MVDDTGFVLSKRGRPLKPSTNFRGYQIINIMSNGKRIGFGVHTAVARAFCDGYSPELQVNHKDGDKTNNAASNLEWVTPEENMQHSVNILGNNVEEKNGNARPIIGRDIKTFEIIYSFPALISAGRYFSNGNEKRARHIQNIICEVIKKKNGKKTYRKCVWEYAD